MQLHRDNPLYRDSPKQVSVQGDSLKTGGSGLKQREPGSWEPGNLGRPEPRSSKDHAKVAGSWESGCRGSERYPPSKFKMPVLGLTYWETKNPQKLEKSSLSPKKDNQKSTEIRKKFPVSQERQPKILTFLKNVPCLHRATKQNNLSPDADKQGSPKILQFLGSRQIISEKFQKK